MSIAIEPVTTTYDVSQFIITDVHTNITNGNCVITFDELDASSAVKSTKTIVATGSDFVNMLDMTAVTNYIVTTQGFILT